MWRYEREQVHDSVAAVLAGLILFATPVAAQMGPVQHSGYLEYNYRLSQADQVPRSTSHNGTWRMQARTWFWRPYILRMFGDLGLTQTNGGTSRDSESSTLVTGGLNALAFSRSRFPLRLYFEQRDSRSESGPIDSDLSSRNWGFAQQLSTNKVGNYILEYRNSDVESLYIDGIRDLRKTNLELWSLTASANSGRNQVDFTGNLRDLERNTTLRAEDRLTLNLRHRFRHSSRFYIEDTTFFSDDSISYDSLDRTRQLFQFNGRSQWVPQTKRPLRVTGSMVVRSIESGSNGFESSMSSASLLGSAVYQATRRLNVAVNVALVNSMPEDGPDSSSVLQRVRTTYRSDFIDLGDFRYDWGGTAEIGNRRQRSHGEDAVQDGLLSLYHGISRNGFIGVGRQLSLSFTQRASTRADTLDRREHSLNHTLAASLNQQKGRSSNYIRLSATDRRATGTRENTFQLVTLQAASRMQVTRKRSFSGSVNVQYSSNSSESEDQERMAGSAVSYGANLSYNERDLFGVRNLDFLSELRLLSSEFRNDDMFDEATLVLDERDTNFWRNRLMYRVGLLQLQLTLNTSELNGTRSSTIYLNIRRYYGDA